MARDNGQVGNKLKFAGLRIFLWGIYGGFPRDAKTWSAFYADKLIPRLIEDISEGLPPGTELGVTQCNT